MDVSEDEEDRFVIDMSHIVQPKITLDHLPINEENGPFKVKNLQSIFYLKMYIFIYKHH